MNQTNNKATAAVPVAALKKAADNIRILSVSMVEKAKSGHPGGAMGGADFVSVLYGCFLRYNPDNMTYPWRDRMFLDPGHMSPMLYSAALRTIPRGLARSACICTTLPRVRTGPLARPYLANHSRRGFGGLPPCN